MPPFSARPYIRRAQARKKAFKLFFLGTKEDLGWKGYSLGTLAWWLVIGLILTVFSSGGPTLEFMQGWPLWLVWFLDVLIVCWSIPVILNFPLVMEASFSFWLFIGVWKPSDIIRDLSAPLMGTLLLNPYADLLMESILVVILSFIILVAFNLIKYGRLKRVS